MAAPETVGIVVVSHSRPLARAAIALAGEMLNGRPVVIEAAAGLDESTLGTDAVAIMAAIERANGPAGVVVLMDLGSAVLSAELALELMADPAARERVVLSSAPIVEGLIVAAVAAAGGADRHEVAAEASSALMGKTTHLGPTSADDPPVEQTGPAASAVAEFTVLNEHGLHARPAARLVGEVRGLDASVQLVNRTTGAGPVPANSLSKVAMLGALRGHDIEVRASGRQAEAAVDQVLALAARRFDEPELADQSRQPTDVAVAADGDAVRAGGTQQPLPAAPGVVVAEVAARLTADADADVPQEAPGDPDVQWRRVVTAVDDVRRAVEQLRERTRRETGPSEAAIFDAHLALLGDPDVLADVEAKVRAGMGAARAWTTCLAAVQTQWSQLPDPYLRERAADVAAVAQQVLRALTGAPAGANWSAGVVVVDDITPADVAALDASAGRGLVLAHGSTSSHAAIIARARSIPMVVSAGSAVLALPAGTPIAVDGGTGELFVHPSLETVEELTGRAAALAERRVQQLTQAGQPAVSRDGVHVEVLANVGSAADTATAASNGADGVGLVRTEFLFLDRVDPPDAVEQEQVYDAICAAIPGRRTVFRTLDVGGDKPLSYLPVPAEANPFLGRRGIRLSLERPQLLQQQLTALCRTARATPIDVMFPMVTSVDELLQARRILDDAALASGGSPRLRVGIMVEVPAAALKIESFLPHVDFVSIGTNDLTQYTVAAERGNPAVAALHDALDPGVLQLVDRVCQGAASAVDVAVCGESASDEVAVPVLAGLGVRELSVSPQAVPAVKALIRTLDVERCRALARTALTLRDAGEVRALVQQATTAFDGAPS